MLQPEFQDNDTSLQRFQCLFDAQERNLLAELRLFINLQRTILNYETDMLAVTAPPSSTYVDLLSRILVNLNVQCLLIRKNLLVSVRFWRGAVPIFAANTAGANEARGSDDLPLGLAMDMVGTTLHCYRRYGQAVLERVTRDSHAAANASAAAAAAAPQEADFWNDEEV